MKKFFLIILLSILYNQTSAYGSWCTSPIGDDIYYCSEYHYTTFNSDTKCDEIKTIKTGELKASFCDKSYFNSVYPEGYFEEGTLSFGRNYYKNFTIKQNEDKYNNHLFYVVAPIGYEDGHKNIIGKKEDFLGVYIDGKRISQFAAYDYIGEYYKPEIYFENAYSIENEITDKNGVQYISNRSGTPSTNYSSSYLRPTTRKKIDTFISKVPVKDIEKVFKNMEILRERYSDYEIEKNLFIKEVLNYIEVELKVKNLLSDEGGIRYVKYHESW